MEYFRLSNSLKDRIVFTTETCNPLKNKQISELQYTSFCRMVEYQQYEFCTVPSHRINARQWQAFSCRW